jgi:[acyl-carrier-protein] S-malonyltransferase
MKQTAYIFPGQGSQYVGMGKDLYEKNDVARSMFNQADNILGISLSRICFEGPEEILRQTENTQPAIFLHSVILTHLMREKDAGMAAGHSLGEYSALVFAGALSFEEGLRLVRLRGQLMQQAGEKAKGTMAAVVGLDGNIVDEICIEASQAGVVQSANFNSPGQIVISGSVPGVRKAMEIAKVRGAKLVKELIVSGAFHSPLMQSAREGLKEGLLSAVISDARIPVYANVTGNMVQKADDIRSLLEQQLINPVRWEVSVKNMIAAGAKKFIEVGPGRVLQGLVKRIDTSAETNGIDKYEEII